jgi:phosphoesterase RecJ-like protein
MTITENNFGYIKLDKKIMDEYKVDVSAASNMVNNFNFIKELYCWAFSSYDEKNKIHKINIRSRGPIINTVASKYNGGGHMYASGARIELESDVDKLFNDLDNATKEYKNRIEN